jgi:hypothetical protein
MKSAQINAFVYKLSSVILAISSVWFIATINLKYAVFFAGMLFINSLSKFLFILEQSKEDDELISQLEELLKEKNGDV